MNGELSQNEFQMIDLKDRIEALLGMISVNRHFVDAGNSCRVEGPSFDEPVVTLSQWDNERLCLFLWREHPEYRSKEAKAFQVNETSAIDR